jgi:hypothetical protein
MMQAMHNSVLFCQENIVVRVAWDLNWNGPRTPSRPPNFGFHWVKHIRADPVLAANLRCLLPDFLLPKHADDLLR